MKRPVWVVVGSAAWTALILATVATGVLGAGVAVAAIIIPATLGATLLTGWWRGLMLALALGAAIAAIAIDASPLWLQLAVIAVTAVGLAAFIGSRLDSQRRHYNTAAEHAELLQSIIHTLPNLVMVKDRTGQIVLANPQAKPALGLEPAAMIGRREADFIADPALVEAFRQADEQVLATGEPYHSTADRWLDGKGRLRWYQTIKSVLKVNGRPTYVLVVATDITERAEAEQKLVEQHRLLQTLVNSLPDFIFVKDANSRYLLANAAHCQLLGAPSMEALLGKTDFDFFSATSTAEFFADEQRVLRTGQPLLDKVETINKEVAEGERWVLASKIPLFDDEGQATHVIGISRDITALKQTEEALREAKDQAEGATRAKSEFLANMSHEIRTPMNAIIGMTNLLLDTDLTADQAEFVSTIRVSGENLLAILNDLLDFSKIESGSMELEQQPFNVLECIEETLDMFAPRAFQKGIELAYTVSESLLTTVIGDSLRLRQVLINLIGNAVKFTERGEVVVAASGETLPQGHYRLSFAVRDTGIGIPSDRRHYLFRSFSQVDASTTRRYGGTGLGLAISKRLVEMMEGEIDVESQPGAGSVFNFHILVHPGASAEQHAPETQSLLGQRVLLVDDNQTNLTILVHQFKRWGLDALPVASSVEALRLLSKGERFDVAVFDMLMPEMDGIQLATHARKTLAGTDLPIILLTSISDADTRMAAREQKFAAVLTKPAKLAQLYEAVSSALGRNIQVQRRLRSQRKQKSDFAALAPVKRPLRILLAEDNPINQKVAMRILSRLGHTPVMVENGREAVDAVQENRYDVILMDIHMPEMDGLEATRQIRRDVPVARQPYIIALTADVMEGFQQRCLDAGMDAYISKPVRIDELAATLQKVETLIAA
jgi:two-component system sensor histidine kinase/response regulator